MKTLYSKQLAALLELAKVLALADFNSWHACTWSVTIRPVLIENVFLVTCPHAVQGAACFGCYCHYLVVCNLSSFTKISITFPSFVSSRRCSNCTGNVDGIMNSGNCRPSCELSSELSGNSLQLANCVLYIIAFNAI